MQLQWFPSCKAVLGNRKSGLIRGVASPGWHIECKMKTGVPAYTVRNCVVGFCDFLAYRMQIYKAFFFLV